MSLRPRYSLLTLLVLTALVAGGVKWWYGPHRVVELNWRHWEAEYSYTRDWNGAKIVDGPVVCRYYEDDELICFYICNYRKGIESDWISYYLVHNTNNFIHRPPYKFRKVDCPLSKQELQLFHEARNVELKRLELANIGYEFQYEGGTYGTFALD